MAKKYESVWVLITKIKLYIPETYGDDLNLVYDDLYKLIDGDRTSGYYLPVAGNCLNGNESEENRTDEEDEDHIKIDEAEEITTYWIVDEDAADFEACRLSCNDNKECKSFQYVESQCRQWTEGNIHGNHRVNLDEKCFIKQKYNPFNVLDWGLNLSDIGIK